MGFGGVSGSRDHVASALLEQGGAHSGSMRLQGPMLQMSESQEQLVPAFYVRGLLCSLWIKRGRTWVRLPSTLDV